MEIWKPVPGFIKYEVSSFGRIRSLIGTSKILKTDRKISGSGYETVILSGNITKSVHVLVATAFHGEPGQTVNHKDGNKRNNTADNLEWLTMGENHKHAYKTGLRKAYDRKVRNSSLAKIDSFHCQLMRNWHDAGFSLNAIARNFNVSRPCVSDHIQERCVQHA